MDVLVREVSEQSFTVHVVLKYCGNEDNKQAREHSESFMENSALEIGKEKGGQERGKSTLEVKQFRE